MGNTGITGNTGIHSDFVLDRCVSGFHIYALDEPVHVSYASKNLCDLLGVERSELESAGEKRTEPERAGDVRPEPDRAEPEGAGDVRPEPESAGEDAYAAYVHAADRERYAAFLAHAAEAGAPEDAAEIASQRENFHSINYRLVTSDGRVLHVKDELSVERAEDGSLIGYSVLSDITELMTEVENLQFLNETIPCGFIKYTCETTPQVTYINEKMLEILGFSENDKWTPEYLDMCKQNIFLMVPVEERRRFGLYLKLVQRRGAPVAGEMTILRSDGSSAYLFGWVTKVVNEQGVEEFQSVCMDITERHTSKMKRDTERYLKALSEVYDLIFEYDLGNCTVKFLYGSDFPEFRWVRDVPMKMDDVTDRWIANSVAKQDREMMRRFFLEFFQNKSTPSRQSPVVQFSMRAPDGALLACSGQFVKVDQYVSLYCCKIGGAAVASDARGISAVASGVASGAAFGAVPAGQGEAALGVSDGAVAGSASLDEGDGLPVVKIRTFGFFDVFVDDKAIAFRNEKSKELFALLVDRRGGFVSSGEAISYLWEDEPVNTVTLARYRKVALRLKNILEEYGIADVVDNVNGQRRLATEKVKCDLYDYLTGRDEYAQLFKGSYLSNYSWAETTLAGLMGDRGY